MHTRNLTCFKAYDVRGRVPDQLNPELAYDIGQAFAAHFSPRRVAIGRDVRLSGPALATSLANGFLDAGVDVIDLGLCGTEEIYFAAFHLDVDGGIVVTASHNPAEYNGMKFVRRGAVPVSGDSGLGAIKALAAEQIRIKAPRPGRLTSANPRPDYVAHLLGQIDRGRLRPLTVVVNAGNGCAGPVIDLLETRLPFRFVKLQHEPDGRFPHGVPNPLLPENRLSTAEAVLVHQADLGVAWDGDFDRCFLFDEQGRFIEGYYLVGLLAEAILARHPGEKIIHDPRLVWNTREIVERAGGVPVMSKTGHAFIKERMRAENAIYGGEMSAHHYFRDFAFCDSGMLPWLLVCEIMATQGLPLSALVNERMAAFPVSGEINSVVADPLATLARVEAAFGQGGLRDDTDGLSVSFPTWRFNLRLSNTEPVIRLNVETCGDQALMESKTQELLACIRKGEAGPA